MLPSNKPEYPPLFPPGFHKKTLDQLKVLCVSGFPTSTTRQDIMNGLEFAIADLEAVGIEGDLWVDGSFLTESVNPKDVDVVLRITSDFWRQTTPAQKDKLRWFEGATPKTAYKCDSYKWIEWPEGHTLHGESEWDRAYWTRQYGFSRDLEYKGIAVVRVGGAK